MAGQTLLVVLVLLLCGVLGNGEDRCTTHYLPVIVNGYMRYQQSPAGKIAKVTCLPGFSSNNNSVYRCEAGTWVKEGASNESPKCLMSKGCPDPPEIPNAKRVTVAGSRSTRSSGFEKYVCDIGFTRSQSPSIYLRCREGKWTPLRPGAALLCEKRAEGLNGQINRIPSTADNRIGPQGCPELTSPDHGVVKLEGEGGNASAVFQCDAGYNLEGPANLNCSHNPNTPRIYSKIGSTSYMNNRLGTYLRRMRSGQFIWDSSPPKCVFDCELPAQEDVVAGTMESTRVKVTHCTKRLGVLPRFDPTQTCAEPQVFVLEAGDHQPGDYLRFTGAQVCGALAAEQREAPQGASGSSSSRGAELKCVRFCLKPEGGYMHIPLRSQVVLKNGIGFVHELEMIDVETSATFELHPRK